MVRCCTAVRYLLDDAHTTDKIVSYGISMGATAALLAAAETPEIAAVISDSSFLSFNDTVDHHVNGFLHLPAFPFSNELKFYIQHRAGFDGSKLDALEAVKRIGDRPVMFIAAAHDRRMPPSIAEELYQACSSSKRELLIIEGPGDNIHGHAYQANPKLYVDRVAAYLHNVLNLAPVVMAEGNEQSKIAGTSPSS
jgi:pimeloyl-ACP methyl ester carboxylesterase